MFISISVENIDNINVDNLISITAKLNQLYSFLLCYLQK